MNDHLWNLLYTQAMRRYPLPHRFRSIVREIQLAAPDEETYLRRVQALMDEEPELARIYALRSALVEAATAHLERGDIYQPETDTWQRPEAGGRDR